MNVHGTSDGKPRPIDRLRTGVLGDSGENRTLLLVGAAIVLVLYLIRDILLPFVVAGVVAYICTPLITWLTKRTGWPRSIFAALVFLVLIGSAMLFVAVAGHYLVAETTGTAGDLQGTIEHLARATTGDQPIRLFGQTIDPAELARTMLQRIGDWFRQVNGLALVAGYGLAAIMGTFLTAALLCYFLLTGPSIGRGLLWTVPPSRRAVVVRIAAQLDPLLKRYFIGMLAIVVYAIVASYIGLGVVLGIGHAPLLAVLTGILETVPIVGTTLAAIIAGLVSLHTATGFMSILAFTVYAIALRLSIDQIVGPLVLGGAAHVHPVVVIFSFFAGAVLFGVPGVILAVPAALAGKIVLANLYGEDGE
ncbi:MAG TPA: AI-2E family transporter [Xanthobacteraceae bacterium]|nr:AI-2E family transporter [Xanthobacteraceae bacterium]